MKSCSNLFSNGIKIACILLLFFFQSGLFAQQAEESSFTAYTITDRTYDNDITISDSRLKNIIYINIDNIQLFKGKDFTELATGGFTVTVPGAKFSSLTKAIVFCNQQIVNLFPVVSAGTAQTIQLPTSTVTLTGTASDSDGTIASTAWSKVSGGTATITSAANLSTTITGLVQGTYVFRLTATDNKGAVSTSDVTVIVQPSNLAPVVSAGTAQTIQLPTSTVTLTGTASDSDGTIASTAWSKVSGGTATITSASNLNTTVTGLVQGTYVFRLTATDNKGAVSTSDVTVTVQPANLAPVVSAGTAQTIQLPTSTVTLTGTASDSDGTIASTAWSKVSGGTATITSASNLNTTVTGLVQGTYVFRLTATDNKGTSSTSEVTITVQSATTSGVYLKARFGPVTAPAEPGWTNILGNPGKSVLPAVTDVSGSGIVIQQTERFVNTYETDTCAVSSTTVGPVTSGSISELSLPLSESILKHCWIDNAASIFTKGIKFTNIPAGNYKLYFVSSFNKFGPNAVNTAVRVQVGEGVNPWGLSQQTIDGYQNTDRFIVFDITVPASGVVYVWPFRGTNSNYGIINAIILKSN